MHSVRIEPTKLILVGMRETYQAPGDAGTTAMQVVSGYDDPTHTCQPILKLFPRPKDVFSQEGTSAS